MTRLDDNNTLLSRRGVLRAAAGSATALAAGAAATGTAAAQDYGGWFTGDARGGAVGNYDGSTADRTGQDEVTVEVGTDANGGSFGFGPAAVRVSPGTTVNFEWVSNTHNVVVQSQPEGADWSGDEEINNEGYSYSHTFETPGVYTYYCNPHLTAGMKGAVVVGAAPGGGSGGGGDGGGSGQRAFAGSTLWKSVFAGGVALAMLAPIAASYYRNRSAPADGEGGVEATDETPEADEFEPETEIGHDDYDPVGTLALVAIYFLILVGMWAFTYFVEFLGNGPTIVG